MGHSYRKAFWYPGNMCTRKAGHKTPDTEWNTQCIEIVVVVWIRRCWGMSGNKLEGIEVKAAASKTHYCFLFNSPPTPAVSLYRTFQSPNITAIIDRDAKVAFSFILPSTSKVFYCGGQRRTTVELKTCLQNINLDVVVVTAFPGQQDSYQCNATHRHYDA